MITDNSTKVTYLLGAGASCQSLPLTNDIPRKLKELHENNFYIENIKSNLEGYYLDSELPNNRDKAQLFEEFKHDFEWLHQELKKKKITIDELADKLDNIDEELPLITLKNILSAYFVLEQAKNKVDNRYDKLIKNAIKGRFNELHPHMNILSWNYDYQIEKAYSRYSNNDKLNMNQNCLNCVSKYQQEERRDKQFSLVKLNGTVGPFQYQTRPYPPYPESLNINQGLNIELFNEVLRRYLLIKNNPYEVIPSLSFAWEPEFANQTIIDEAITATSKTEILVVIGYSFPCLNKEIDRRIISSMKNLRKVYFQAPDAEELKERFYSIRNDIKDSNLIPKENTDQFFIPHEL